MKKILAILAMMAALTCGVYGQYYYGGMSGYYTFPRTNYTLDSSGNIRFQPGDLGFSLQAGAFAGSNFRGSTWFGTSVSPALAYNVSSRFRIKTGVTIVQGFGNGYYGGFEGSYAQIKNNPTTTGIFIQGDYLLSNKLMLSGAVYKYFSPFNTSDPTKKGPEGESYQLNLNYRPIRNFEINASFGYSKGTGLYHHDPFYQPWP
jgi:hypothetical protein